MPITFVCFVHKDKRVFRVIFIPDFMDIVADSQNLDISYLHRTNVLMSTTSAIDL